MKEFDELKKIIDTLRSPGGCPWDRKQNHESLLEFLYEEAGEVGDAIIRNDMPHLMEELGDLLLQIMLHSRIAEEEKRFNIKDVLKTLSEKLVRRHPHVFGHENAEHSDEVIKLWERIKNEEKKHKNEKHLDSILDKVSANFSSLIRSFELQKTAAKVGFDWKNYKGVLDKIEEEIGELKEAIDKNINIEGEIGDLIFALVNLARFLKINANVALEKANNRFINRFKYIEKKVKDSGKEFKDFSLEHLEEFWQEAKKEEKRNR